MRAPLWGAVGFGIFAALTAILWGVAHRAGRRQVATETKLLAGQVGERIRACMHTRVEMISQIRREWELGGIRDDAEFSSRAEALITTFPGYLAVNRIDDGVISFVHPLEANRSALGRKLADTPAAFAEYSLAVTSGNPRLTPPIELFQAGTGVAVYVPTRVAGAKQTVLNGVFRTDALIRLCLGVDDVPGYSLEIRDGDKSVYTREDAHEVADLAAATTLPLFNRTWSLRVAPASEHEDDALGPSRMILLSGVPLSAAIGLLVFSLLTIRNRARARARLAEEQRQAERQRVEAKLQQVQRMEALGQLAAAVAHDFNNLLTIIIASSYVIGERSETPAIKEAAHDIDEAARRGAALSRELVTFGRGDASPAAKLDLGAHVSGLQSMLNRLVGSAITLELRTSEKPAYVHCSVVHIEQIVVNLVVNATAAMPDGGKLTIEVTSADGIVTLAVSDTGVGIDPAIVPRIFEPFFSTKAPTEGSGLGLATVYGHVQRLNGEIKVESTLGAGTRFVLTFPAA